jgi:hypothetical protein
MIQSLTSEPSFGIQISLTPIRISLPSKWNVVGTAADFFVSVSWIPDVSKLCFESSAVTLLIHV